VGARGENVILSGAPSMHLPKRTLPIGAESNGPPEPAAVIRHALPSGGNRSRSGRENLTKGLVH
jgi:hypothetical protein